MEIKTLKVTEYGSGFSLVNSDDILLLKADYKEAIEALCFLMNGVDGLPSLTAIANALTEEWRVCQGVVEKAYSEFWEDIRNG